MIKFLRSLGCSLQGIRSVIAGERNMRFHLVAAVVVIGAGIWLKISRYDWGLIALAITAVMAAECFNAAIERLADRVTTEKDPLIKVAKDAAAGAVLLVSIGAAVVGALVFLPKVGM